MSTSTTYYVLANYKPFGRGTPEVGVEPTDLSALAFKASGVTHPQSRLLVVRGVLDGYASLRVYVDSVKANVVTTFFIEYTLDLFREDSMKHPVKDPHLVYTDSGRRLTGAYTVFPSGFHHTPRDGFEPPILLRERVFQTRGVAYPLATARWSRKESNLQLRHVKAMGYRYPTRP